jgi:hypothetical protein
MFASICPPELFLKVMVSVFQKYKGTVIFLDETEAHGASRGNTNRDWKQY